MHDAGVVATAKVGVRPPGIRSEALPKEPQGRARRGFDVLRKLRKLLSQPYFAHIEADLRARGLGLLYHLQVVLQRESHLWVVDEHAVAQTIPTGVRLHVDVPAGTAMPEVAEVLKVAQGREPVRIQGVQDHHRLVLQDVLEELFGRRPAEPWNCARRLRRPHVTPTREPRRLPDTPVLQEPEGDRAYGAPLRAKLLQQGRGILALGTQRLEELCRVHVGVRLRRPGLNRGKEILCTQILWDNFQCLQAKRVQGLVRELPEQGVSLADPALHGVLQATQARRSGRQPVLPQDIRLARPQELAHGLPWVARPTIG
mmetsp:Transcript_23417/g.73781  ORF Transcript_23417/g.73781 Transcript_23417/m.73781 type:complete len:314 (+) Transcript_23417:470-1411(+)